MIKFLKKIKNNRPAIVHSDLLSFGRTLENNKKNIIKIFTSHFQKGLFIPSFSFGSNDLVRYDKFENSMGSLTNICIRDSKFKRTLNPIHSYIYCKYNYNFNKYKNFSFGNKSIFNFFYKENFTWVNLGLKKSEGFTIFHHVEDLCDVPYRKRILLNKKIHIRKTKNYNFNYFARKNKIKYNFSRAVNAMLKDKILTQTSLPNKNKIYFGGCKKIVDYLVIKLNKNKKYFLL